MKPENTPKRFECPRCKEELTDDSIIRKHFLCVLCRPGMEKLFRNLKHLKDFLKTT